MNELEMAERLYDMLRSARAELAKAGIVRDVKVPDWDRLDVDDHRAWCRFAWKVSQMLGIEGDPRRPEMIAEDRKRADEYAERGTLKHYLLKKGFFPDNEEVAERMLDGIIKENEGR